MSTKAITKATGNAPVLFSDFFKPWNEWFPNGDNLWNNMLSMPAVNITENEKAYQVSLAAPGMKKEDFKIDVDGNILSISAEKEESTEEKEKKFTRREYSYSSFSRSFTLPDEVNQEKIEAAYEAGVLNLTLPRREEAKKTTAKQIAVK